MKEPEKRVSKKVEPGSISDGSLRGLFNRIESQYSTLKKKVASEMTEVNIQSVVGMAKKAALDYVKDGVDLNETIHKVAVEKDLNPQQIQRVVEMKSHIHMY